MSAVFRRSQTAAALFGRGGCGSGCRFGVVAAAGHMGAITQHLLAQRGVFAHRTGQRVNQIAERRVIRGRAGGEILLRHGQRRLLLVADAFRAGKIRLDGRRLGRERGWRRAARRDGRRIVGDESSHVRQRAVKQIRINIAHFSILPPARTRGQKARAGKPNLF